MGVYKLFFLPYAGYVPCGYSSFCEPFEAWIAENHANPGYSEYVNSAKAAIEKVRTLGSMPEERLLQTLHWLPVSLMGETAIEAASSGHTCSDL